MASSDFTLRSNMVSIFVSVEDDDRWKSALDYCEIELAGSYAWDHDLAWASTSDSDVDKMNFFFSDPDAAFQFKMRFG